MIKEAFSLGGRGFDVVSDESGSKIVRKTVARTLPSDTLTHPIKYVDPGARPPANKPFLKKRTVKEDAPANAVGSGAIAGVGVPNPNLPKQAEPGVRKRKKKTLKDFRAGRKIVTRVNV